MDTNAGNTGDAKISKLLRKKEKRLAKRRRQKERKIQRNKDNEARKRLKEEAKIKKQGEVPVEIEWVSDRSIEYEENAVHFMDTFAAFQSVEAMLMDPAQLALLEAQENEPKEEEEKVEEEEKKG